MRSRDRCEPGQERARRGRTRTASKNRGAQAPARRRCMGKLTSEQQLMVATVRQFVDKEVMPVASAMEHRNEYTHELVAQMQKMSLFGLNVPEQYGGADVD